MPSPLRRILPLAFLLGAAASAQEELPVLEARSPVVDVQDGGELLRGAWTVDPALALDVYEVRRSAQPKRVSFLSDLGSLAFDVEPGRTVDFVIRLAGKGDCRTRVSRRTQGYRRLDGGGSGLVEIPLSITHGKLHLVGRFGASAPLDLIFDTGANGHLLYPSAFDKGVAPVVDGAGNNSGTGGTTLRRTSSDNRLEIGGLFWEHETLTLVEKQADEADGLVGYTLFEDRVVELDFERGVLVVHDALPAHAAQFTRTPMPRSGALTPVELSLVHAGGRASGWFHLDTGGTDTLLVNQAFGREHGLYDALERLGTSTSRGVGSAVLENARVRVPALELAGFVLRDVPLHVELPSDANPAPPGGVVCMEVLRRFDALLDYPNGQAYFRPNAHFAEPFPEPRPDWVGRALALALLALAALLVRAAVRRGRAARAAG